MVKQPARDQVEARPDEYTITELFCSVWRKRGIVILALLIGTLIGIAAAASSISKVPAPVTYHVALSGMETSQSAGAGADPQPQISVSYPNGVAFLPRDLLDRQVIQRVKEQLGLGDEVRLNSGIGVSFDSPLSEGIIRRYKDRLAARGLTQADIDALNRDLERDLLAANMSGLRIDVSPTALGVSNDVAIAVAKALPQAWRDVYVERYRTLLVPSLPNLAKAQGEEDLGAASGKVAAQMKIVSMMRGLDIMREDNRIAGVQNTAGQTASDLESELRQFRTVTFEPFAAAVFASNDPSVASYRKDLEMRLDAAKREAQAIDRTIQDMLNNPMGTTNLQPSSDSNVQMDGTMLSQVLGLAQRASLTPLMPDMFDRREKVAAEISRLQNELVMASAEAASPGVPESASAISTELIRLTEAYRDLYSIAFDRLRATSSEFYVDLSAPSIAKQHYGTRALALLLTPILLALVISAAYLVLAALFKRVLSRR